MLRERIVLQKAIDKYGEEAQLKMVLEEMSELQKEICKRWIGQDNAGSIAEEVADVEIMLVQLKMMLGIEPDVENCRLVKLLRLQERLEETGNESGN